MEPTSLKPQAHRLSRYYIRILIVVILLALGFLVYLGQPPSAFPIGSIITVPSGGGLTSVANDLKSKRIFRSSTLFKTVIVLLAGEQKLIAGSYYFDKPVSVYKIAERLIKGNFGLTSLKITIPEGVSMRQIAVLLAARFPKFSVEEFMKYYPEKEGFLFPDTYYFMPDAQTDVFIETLEKNFKEKIVTLEPSMTDFGRSKKEVITMASILEEEAQTPEDFRIIAGILWKRIKIGMPLQVDSTLGYVTDKASSELTTSDLKIDSPYNSYVYKGLPPTPISNPGLETITAAVTPTTTPYLYYLSDKNGDIHYAATFDEHIKNRKKFLK